MQSAAIVLASASPRRLALLQAACFTVEVRCPDADETWPGGIPQAAAVQLARRKLARVRPVAGLCVAADTVVVLGERVLGKPRDAADAAGILRQLAGLSHEVITGFVVAQGEHERHGAVTTQVRFRPLTDREIDRYVMTGESLDKAGAYGIQGLGGALIASLHGSYTNVVGLPLAEVLAAIEALSVGPR